MSSRTTWRSALLRLPLVLAALAPCAPLAAAGESSPPPAPAAQAAPKPSARVNVNTATAADLETLPRIGPSTAQRILEYRKQVGTLKSVDELLNVKGIGERTLELLKPLITVGSQPAGSGGNKP